MPVPEAFEEAIQVAPQQSPYVDLGPYKGILYVTDREPATADDNSRFYQNDRGSALRVGSALIGYVGKEKTVEELQEIALAKSGTRKFPLAVTELNEMGILGSALPYGKLTQLSQFGDTPSADESLTDAINAKLAQSARKDVYLYVHGYKVVFENPLLIAAQLWHFMGYDGVFMPYAWPSTPKRLAYFKDLETAELSANNLRLFLEFLAVKTNVEKVHIIGYSAGTRVVIEALQQLALKQQCNCESANRLNRVIGQIALVGSDYDRERWAAGVANGLLDIVDGMTIYVSETDKALGMSRFVFREGRLGQMSEVPDAHIHEWLEGHKKLNFIDVTGVVGSKAGGGHAYFRTSPWVSSDLLSLLLYQFSPKDRGLERIDGDIEWTFPTDYNRRLGAAIRNQKPKRVNEREINQ